MTQGRSVMRICFLIRQLNIGGAQRQLIELVKGLDKTGFDITVVTFYDGGRFRSEMADIPGIRLISMSKQSRWDVVTFFLNLVSVVRGIEPDVLHGYLGVSNLLCVAIRPFLKRTRLVWGVRASYKDLRRYDWLTRITFWLERVLSRLPDEIIANSWAGREFYVSQGFPARKMIVVPNGIDVDRYRPNVGSGTRLRMEWGIANGDHLIGLVGRLDPRKDHPTFLRAASGLARERPDVRFVCVGDGPADYRSELEALGESLGLGDRLSWTGMRSDMPAVYNALDILTSSSSFGEGFPNVVGEAMASGVPCVVTDVGDSRRVVGEAGSVVTPGDIQSIMAAWHSILDLTGEQRTLLGKKARTRIVEEFGRDVMIRKTVRALAMLL